MDHARQHHFERPAGDLVANTRSDRVRRHRSLAGRSARVRHGLFLVEGPQGVREAVRHAPGRVRELFATFEAAERHPDVVAAARESGVLLRWATAEVVEAMSSDAQGLLAIVAIVRAELADVIARPPKLVAVMSQVRDPGNAGTVIRAADAAGADAVVLTTGSVDLHSPKVVRSSAGSLFHLPVVAGVELGAALGALREAGLTVLAADGGGEHDVEDSPMLSEPTAWLFGTEAHGLSAQELALADATVRVPLRGRAESLNVAMAATICLYASSRELSRAARD